MLHYQQNLSDYSLMILSGRKSIRKSTAVKSLETQQRIKIRSELKKKKVKKVEEKMPSQEELLEEALITEQENLKSLGMFYCSLARDFVRVEF